ncbi:hypothetical protein AYO21_01390 [Fonsecaea monophora]|uniref:NADP-dependent oxidoreductase domain-containing protein n=1 Tax=Fonsecaea monophora TaxID=254056 RepID=A0A177FJB7_9EURO|nr:hypothetical protein AYO21_01390 [Fonsecaea monophora]OAG44394.1 hypothetical protein AYO21_01390 [Fonsecaea monophora]
MSRDNPEAAKRMFDQPRPHSLLGYHRQLAPAASLKVSPLCLGAMNLGEAWKYFMGAVDKTVAFEILDCFYERGGNFIDTASDYQDGESEAFIGEWMAARGNRDEMVISTKYGTGWKKHLKGDVIQTNFGGLNAKNLRHSLDASLRKLQTDFVDILYVHWWDYAANIPEIMHALNDVVAQGKVLYLGISATPAWIVARANEYARCHNLRPFVIYQGRWSAACRDLEREIIPMCRAEGMAIGPWGVMEGGKFKAKEEREAGAVRGRLYPGSEAELRVSEALEAIAQRKQARLTGIALAYVMHKTPYVFPVVGARTPEQLKQNIEALSVSLSRHDIEEIESVAAFDRGFPYNLLMLDNQAQPEDISGHLSYNDVPQNRAYGHVRTVPYPQALSGGPLEN